MLTQCREFENAMSKYFNDVDVALYENIIQTNAWSTLTPIDDRHASLIAHVAGCQDCADNLLKYLNTRGQFNYHKYPCFHTAYYSNSEKEHCINFYQGLFAIKVVSDPNKEIILGFCPWCGVQLD